MTNLKVMKKQKLNKDFEHWKDVAIQYGYDRKQFIVIIKKEDIVEVFCSCVYDYDYHTIDISKYDKIVELVKNYNESFSKLKFILKMNLGGI
ncbi:MAG: hypothetical protein ACRC7S_16450 [Cetobacterium sp.]